MKSWLRGIIFTIFAGFSLYFDVYHIGSHSCFLFGEPEFPVEK